MIQPGERAAGSASGGRVQALLRGRLALLLDEVAVGSPDLSRIGLASLSLALGTLVLFSPGHFRPAGSAVFAVLVALGTLGSLMAACAATLHVSVLPSVPVRRVLSATALILLVVLSTVGVAQAVTAVGSLTTGPPYSNDGAVMDLYAATQVRAGHNPYLRTNIVKALAAIDAPSTTTTPLMDGQFRGARAYPSVAAIQQVFANVLRYRPGSIPAEFESKYNYPAGSFLFILPFVFAGMHDMRFLYALAILGMAVYLWYRLPRTLRILAPFLVVSDVPLIVLSRGGQPDPLYGLFLMVGMAEWTSPWLSPLTFGVAVGTKQLAWFFLPFYLALILRTHGRKEAIRRGTIIAAVFLALNGPFIVQSPAAYVSSVAGPMTDPMFPLGIGVIAIFVSNVLPMLPKLAFTAAEIASWAGGLAWFARSRYVSAASAAALGALPLFFAWRSLVNYFYLVPLLAVAVLFASQQRRPDGGDLYTAAFDTEPATV